MNKDLSIVIPCYNEQNRIGSTLEKIIAYFSNTSTPFEFFELIIVDDGSKDNTIGIVRETIRKLKGNFINFELKILVNEKNSGKGYSVRKGVLASHANLVLFSDADLSTPIEEIEKLYPYINEGYDIVIGSRGLKQSQILKRQIKIREFAGKTFNFFVRKLTGLEFMDTQCGFKLFNKKSVELIFPLLKINDFSFDVEILFLAKKKKLNIKEIPVKWINSEESKVNVIKDSLKMFKNIIKIKKIHA